MFYAYPSENLIAGGSLIQIHLSLFGLFEQIHLFRFICGTMLKNGVTSIYINMGWSIHLREYPPCSHYVYPRTIQIIDCTTPITSVYTIHLSKYNSYFRLTCQFNRLCLFSQLVQIPLPRFNLKFPP